MLSYNSTIKVTKPEVDNRKGDVALTNLIILLLGKYEIFEDFRQGK